VYEYAHSPLLLSLMRLLWASLHPGPRVSRTHAESARQHDEILSALTEGDAAAASARTYQHIMYVFDEIGTERNRQTLLCREFFERSPVLSY